MVDGNKRLGWLATAVFVELNGVATAHARNDDVFEFVMGVAGGALSVEAMRTGSSDSWEPRRNVPRMARLIYSAIMSLDGNIADEHGNFDWAAPDEEVHQYFNDLEREVGTHLYGRRMYETMVYWETAHTFADSPVELDYARVWQAADKVVYSTTLETVSSERTRIERDFDPEAVRQMKAAADRDLSIGGAELAGQALGAGLVDECHVFVVPVLVGGGAGALPDGVRQELELLDERRFGNGMVHLNYRVRP